MMMEIGMLVRAHESKELLLDYERHFLRDPRFQARPHWGLDLCVLEGSAEVAVLYPRWSDWLAVYRELNARGTFDGQFTDRLGISVAPRASAPHSAGGI